jgi:hypothetical protein
LSNTPLRELIGEHKTFWEAEIPEETLVKGIWDHQDIQKVPDLEAYIVNLWPTKEKRLPYDYDGQVDRRNDILYHDKTKYDQKVAVFVTDYIDLAKKIKELATKHIKDQNEKSAFQKELDDFLKVTDAKSEFRTGIQRKYIDLLKGRFNISKVERIERQDDIHTISNKWADFSSGTINNMRNCGYQEALAQLKVRHQ